MEILSGKKVAKDIKLRAKERALALKRKPTLACIIVEGDKASEVYVASKEKACAECNVGSIIIRLASDVSQGELESQIEKLNARDDVDGILLQLPIPKHLNSRQALDKISPQKDVDCLNSLNLGKLLSAEQTVAPCTPSGIIKLLKSYNLPIEGKHAVVIGRSLLVGKSVACLLEQNNATVTLCHSRTKNLSEITKSADILVVAIGKSKYIDKSFVKEGGVIIDVGINREDGKLCGDVDFDNVKDVAGYITPVPGGVGPLTVACLIENTIILAENHIKENGDV